MEMWLNGGVCWGAKHITFYSAIKEKFTFLYGGGNKPKPFNPFHSAQRKIKHFFFFGFISFLNGMEAIKKNIITVILANLKAEFGLVKAKQMMPQRELERPGHSLPSFHSTILFENENCDWKRREVKAIGPARRAFLPFLHQIKFMNWFDWKKREESEGWRQRRSLWLKKWSGVVCELVGLWAVAPPMAPPRRANNNNHSMNEIKARKESEFVLFFLERPSFSSRERGSGEEKTNERRGGPLPKAGGARKRWKAVGAAINSQRELWALQLAFIDWLRSKLLHQSTHFASAIASFPFIHSLNLISWRWMKSNGEWREEIQCFIFEEWN